MGNIERQEIHTLRTEIGTLRSSLLKWQTQCADLSSVNEKLHRENAELRILLRRWLASTTDVSSSEAQETMEALNGHQVGGGTV